VEIKIKWIKRKQMTHENTYRDDTCMKSLKEVKGQIVSVVTVNDFLSVVGEKFFNDYLRIDTKRFPISVK
jgi:hypothetical protein